MLVLAGGRSQRMGRDKAWLPVAGRPALLRVLAAARDAGIGAVVVGSPGQSLPALGPDVVRVDDPADRRHEGPLSGLAVGLQCLHERGIQRACLATCDALWLGAAHVRFVLEALVEDHGRDAVVPVSEPEGDGRRVLHPLCGAVRVAAAEPVARALVESGQRAARALMLELRAHPIAVDALPEPRVVEGCNTPEQWARAVAGVVAALGDHEDRPPAVE